MLLLCLSVFVGFPVFVNHCLAFCQPITRLSSPRLTCVLISVLHFYSRFAVLYLAFAPRLLRPRTFVFFPRVWLLRACCLCLAEILCCFFLCRAGPSSQAFKSSRIAAKKNNMAKLDVLRVLNKVTTMLQVDHVPVHLFLFFFSLSFPLIFLDPIHLRFYFPDVNLKPGDTEIVSKQKGEN